MLGFPRVVAQAYDHGGRAVQTGGPESKDRARLNSKYNEPITLAERLKLVDTNPNASGPQSTQEATSIPRVGVRMAWKNAAEAKGWGMLA